MALVLPTTATAAGSGSTGTLQSGGVLRLHLGAQDYFAFQDAAGTGYVPAPFAQQQSVGTSSGCKLSLATSPAAANLVSISPSSGSTYAGFVADGIGVKSQGEGAGTPCGRIDPDQQLTVNLTQTAGATLVGKMIDFAELDLEGKFGVTMQVDGYLVVAGQQPKLMASEQYPTTPGSDSGPDSGDADNFRIRFPRTGTTLVNQLVFKVVGSTGGMSLEGGADGTQPCDADDGCTEPSLGQSLASTTDSLFHLVNVDGVLDCGQVAPSQGGGTTPLNSLTRLENATGDPADCVPIPYNLDSGITNCPPNSLQCILLQKDLLGQDAQFEWTVTWAPEPGSYQESKTQFDFDGDGIFSDIQQCLADGLAGNGTDGFPDLPPSNEAGDPAGTIDPWCVEFTSSTLIVNPVNGQTYDQVKETYFGSGDPGGKRL